MWLILFTNDIFIFFIGIFLNLKTFSSDLICSTFCIHLDPGLDKFWRKEIPQRTKQS